MQCVVAYGAAVPLRIHVLLTPYSFPALIYSRPLSVTMAPNGICGTQLLTRQASSGIALDR